VLSELGEEDYVGIDRCLSEHERSRGWINDVHTTERGGYCRRGVSPFLFPFSLSFPLLSEKVGNSGA